MEVIFFPVKHNHHRPDLSAPADLIDRALFPHGRKIRKATHIVCFVGGSVQSTRYRTEILASLEDSMRRVLEWNSDAKVETIQTIAIDDDVDHADLKIAVVFSL